NYALYQVENGVLRPIDPRKYRQYIEDTLIINEDKELALIQSVCPSEQCIPEEDLAITFMDGFTEKELAHLKPDACFANFPLISSDHWVPLPGLSDLDQISHMVKPPGSKVRFNPLHSQYEIYWPIQPPQD